VSEYLMHIKEFA